MTTKQAHHQADLKVEVLENTARMLKCLGHPLRLRILDLLEEKGEQTVSEVQEALDLEQAVCSQHLSLMRNKGILARRKDGVHVYYSIGDRRSVKVLGCLRTKFELFTSPNECARSRNVSKHPILSHFWTSKKSVSVCRRRIYPSSRNNEYLSLSHRPEGSNWHLSS